MSQMNLAERLLPSPMAPIGGGSPIEQLSVSKVYPDNLAEVWPCLLPGIRRGLQRGAGDTLSAEGLFRGVITRGVELWLAHRGDEIFAGVFLQIEKRERGRALVVLDVVAVNGRGFRQYAEKLLPIIREYATLIGAYTVEGVTRPGAARILTSLGCKPKAIIMELGNGRQFT
jgi:hypothetical protein